MDRRHPNPILGKNGCNHKGLPSHHNLCRQSESKNSFTNLISLNILNHKKSKETVRNHKILGESLSHKKDHLKNPERIEYYNQVNGLGKKQHVKTDRSQKSNSNPSLSKKKIPNRQRSEQNLFLSSSREQKANEKNRKEMGSYYKEVRRIRKESKYNIRDSIGLKLRTQSNTSSKRSESKKNMKTQRVKSKSKKLACRRQRKERRDRREIREKDGSLSKTKEKTFRNSQFSKSSLEGKNQLNYQKGEVKNLPTNSMLREDDESLSLIRQNLVEEIYSSTCSVHKLSLQGVRERFKCVSMLAKISSSMQLKRNSFLLALAYLEKYLEANVEIRSIKAATIAALMIALKVEHAQVFGSLTYQFNGVAVSSSQNVGSEEEVETPVSNNKYSFQSEKTKPQPLMVQKQKMPNILNVVLSHEEIFSEYDRILCKEEINDIEMQIMIRLNFRLELKGMSHWVHVLYCLWEKYIDELSQEGTQLFEDEIMDKLPAFKSKPEANIVPFVYQISEVCEIVSCNSAFSKPTIVVSVLYLLVRIRVEYAVEEWERGFDFYRGQLCKSANSIFIDKTGTNEIFGQYLGVLGLDMRHLVASCQHVSKFLIFRVIRSAVEDWKRSSFSSDPSLYHFSPELFRFFSTRIQE